MHLRKRRASGSGAHAERRQLRTHRMPTSIGCGEGGRAGMRFGLLSPMTITLLVCLVLTGTAAGPAEQQIGTGGPERTEDNAVAVCTITLEAPDMIADATPIAGTRPRFVSGSPADSEFVRLAALPDCREARITSVTWVSPDGTRRSLPLSAARVRDLGRIREQTIAVIALERSAAPAGGRVEITVEPVGARGPAARDAGPFTEACRRIVAGYDPVATGMWRPPSRGESRDADVTYCYSSADCAAAGIDFLFVAASDFAYSPAIYALAVHHASTLGLNIGIVSTEVLDELTPEALKGFLEAVYDAGGAEHFGDGRLGFVLLLGDAVADDNESVMIPAYYGYGGNEEASDHYYACLSGDDDFEDVMLGRLSVGNLTEVVRVVNKAWNYMPLPQGAAWRNSALMIGGLFYSTREQYVQLFNGYESILPDTMTVDRIYRHDFPNDAACASNIIDELNDGHLFTTFIGDGWIHEWHRAMKSTHIAQLENSDRLPIVLSMACMTGWFDNTTQVGPSGSYDCFAELLVNAENSGAIACLAAPRPTDGGVYTTLTEDIFRAAFEEHCVYLGELFATAKLLHLESGGQAKYARHFNLFGDPGLVFAWNALPGSGTDLVIRPHELVVSPEFPSHQDALSVSVTVTNQSAVDAAPVVLRVLLDGPSGQVSEEIILPFVRGWSEVNRVFTFPESPVGTHTVTVTVDPSDAIDELDESNNSASREVFIYPSLAGFPVDLGTDPTAPAIVATTGASRSIVLQGADGRTRSITADGSIDWESDPVTPPLRLGPELATAAGDLDGDGDAETVVLKRMGAVAYEADGTPMWTADTAEPLGRPVIADADGDGDGDVILSVWNLFGGESMVTAIDEGGSTVWSWTVPDGHMISTAPVAGDLDLDGRMDIACGTEEGFVHLLSGLSGSPVELWPGGVDVDGEIRTLALADIDRNGVLELLVGCGSLLALDVSGTELWSCPLDGDVVSLSVGNFDGDSAREVIAGTVSGKLYLIDAGAPVWSVDLGSQVQESCVVVDLDGDGVDEIVAATTSGDVIVLETDGTVVGEPIPVPGGAHTPFADDLDGDGVAELCVAGETGLIFAFDLWQDPVAVEWAGLAARSTRTGVLEQPFSGEISGPVVLSGDYWITDNLTVSAEGRLTLAAGTELTFLSGPTSLTVHGELVAEGTAEQPVTLRGSSLRGDWAGLTFYGGSTVTLTNCRIDDATFGMRGQQSTVALNSVQIQNARFGADLSQTAFQATDCVFTDADSSGLRLTNGSTGTVRNSTVSGCTRRGIELRRQTTVRLVSTLVTGVVEGHGIVCTRSSNAVIDSCMVTDNGGHGILASGSAPEISYCEISGNEDHGVRSIKVGAPRIARSTITDNEMGVSVEQGSTAILGSNMYPETGYNSIYGNTRAAVANYNGVDSPVFARWNWWGSPTPYGRLFIGHVAYNPWLDAPPDDRPSLAGDELPTAFVLHPNRPNPFNPVTTLRLEVPAGGGDVDVSVYDVAGRRVATLHSGPLPAGEHSLRWSGRDRHGNAVATGVYFGRMEAPGYTHTVRMLLLK
ncbi:MAG: DUF1565 domain-containing protein [Candidatus Eisenbacteria bacterium]|nr:DUF1565 domain-containing protein [Candidatus Eisenbacteria bacterium]